MISHETSESFALNASYKYSPAFIYYTYVIYIFIHTVFFYNIKVIDYYELLSII